MDVWDREALDLVEPAHLVLESNGMGSLIFIAIEAGVDYRVVDRDGRSSVEFSWAGFSELDPISGRGTAEVVGDEMRGRLFIHAGDESAFVATRSD